MRGEPELLGWGRADARDFVFGRSEDRRSSSSLRSSVYDCVMRQQVPKPMRVYALEGELPASIANGDRLV